MTDKISVQQRLKRCRFLTDQDFAFLKRIILLDLGNIRTFAFILKKAICFFYFFPINERMIGIPSMPHAFFTEWVRKRE
jgi:hypothetical protein